MAPASSSPPQRATTAAAPAGPRPFRSLAARLVLVGVVQLVLLALTAIAIFVAQGPREPGAPHEIIDGPMLQRLEALAGQPAEIQHVLDGIKAERVEVSLYDGNKQLLASNVEPPLAIPLRPRWSRRGERRAVPAGAAPAPGATDELPRDVVSPAADAERRARLAQLGAPGRVLVVPYRPRGERGFLVARGVHPRPSFLTGPLLTLICGFAILVLGALLTARWIVRPIDQLSRTARALGAGDLSARSRLARADEIGELGRRIDEMADRIGTLLVTEKELLANVAHELRTPLSRIGVALDLAGEGDAEAARASLAEIAVDVDELETIVDDILTAMRFEVATTAALPLRRTITPPAEIAHAAAARARTRHGTRPLELAVADDLPPIDVDPMLFRRVIDNLLENAHKYSPEPAAPLALAVARDGDGVVFEVRDRGIGILPEDLPRVFTAFFRGDRSRSRQSGGVGLGLTLAKRIVEAHAGTIAIASTPGAGTTVRVRVPALR